MLPHFRQRVNESPRQDENFGTFGLFLSFFVSELRPFKVKDKFFQCIFEALFINSANALFLTAVLRIWGTYDPIESWPFELKKWGFHRCSVKKCRISGRKCSFLAQNPFFCQKRPTILLPSWPDNKKTTFLCWSRCTAGLGAAAGARFWPENLLFFTLRLYNPHFFGSDGPDSMGS